MSQTAKKTIELIEHERDQIEQMLSRGRHLATHVKRARILRFLDRGYTPKEVVELVECSRTTV